MWMRPTRGPWRREPQPAGTGPEWRRGQARRRAGRQRHLLVVRHKSGVTGGAQLSPRGHGRLLRCRRTTGQPVPVWPTRRDRRRATAMGQRGAAALDQKLRGRPVPGGGLLRTRHRHHLLLRSAGLWHPQRHVHRRGLAALPQRIYLPGSRGSTAPPPRRSWRFCPASAPTWT